MSWYGSLWQRFVDKFLDYWLDAVVVGLATAVGFYVKDWLFKPVSIWPIALVIAVVIIVVLTIRLYKQSPKRFKPFPVHDKYLDAVWWVQSDPKDWTRSTFDHHPNRYTDGLLDGPLCRSKKESGDLCLGGFSQINDSILSERCRICGRVLFKDEEGNAKSVNISRSELKLEVIHSLQREARRGKKIGKNFAFGVIDLKR